MAVTEQVEAWQMEFSRTSSSAYDGFVESLHSLTKLITAFEVATNSRFAVARTMQLFGRESDIDLGQLKPFSIRWQDTQPDATPHIVFDAVPFVLVGKRRFECQHGPDRNVASKKKLEKDHLVQRGETKKGVRSTKKMGCPAQIRVRHVVRMPQYELQDGDSKADRFDKSMRLKLAVRQHRPVQLCHRYYVHLPKPTDHLQHPPQSAASVQPMDRRLSAHIKWLVTECGVTSASAIRPLLEHFLTEDLFSGRPLPARTDRRFWPSWKDVHNHMKPVLARACSEGPQSDVAAALPEWSEEIHEQQLEMPVVEIPTIDFAEEVTVAADLMPQEAITNSMYDAPYETVSPPAEYSVAATAACDVLQVAANELIDDLDDHSVDGTDRRLDVSDQRLDVTDQRLDVSDQCLDVTGRLLAVTDQQLDVSDHTADVTDQQMDAAHSASLDGVLRKREADALLEDVGTETREGEGLVSGVDGNQMEVLSDIAAATVSMSPKRRRTDLVEEVYYEIIEDNGVYLIIAPLTTTAPEFTTAEPQCTTVAPQNTIPVPQPITDVLQIISTVILQNYTSEENTAEPPSTSTIS